MHTGPDVVHVGFSKCASTFLRSFFEAHPQTFLVSNAHYFVPFEHCRYDRGQEYYSSLFQDAATEQIKVESDEHIVLPLLHPVLRAAATTLESVREASARVKKASPNAKIVLVVRNQAALMLSRYGEYVMSGRDLDFEKFVSEFLCCSEDKENYYQNYYSKIVQILIEDFSDENVLVLLQEELQENEDKAIRKLCDFLGISDPPTNLDEGKATKRLLSLDWLRVVARSGKQSRNRGLSRTGIRIMRLWNRLLVREPEEAYYKKAKARLPYSLYKTGVRVIRVVDYYLPGSWKGDKRGLLTPDIADEIRNHFREDNIQFGSMIAVDLSRLGY